jgi:hypothetical protein
MMIGIATVNDKQQPLAFCGCLHRLWQWRWQSSTAMIAVVVNVNDRTAGGADKFGRPTMQQAKSDRQHNNQPSTGALEVQ